MCGGGVRARGVCGCAIFLGGGGMGGATGGARARARVTPWGGVPVSISARAAAAARPPSSRSPLWRRGVTCKQRAKPAMQNSRSLSLSLSERTHRPNRSNKEKTNIRPFSPPTPLSLSSLPALPLPAPPQPLPLRRPLRPLPRPQLVHAGHVRVVGNRLLQRELQALKLFLFAHQLGFHPFFGVFQLQQQAPLVAQGGVEDLLQGGPGAGGLGGRAGRQGGRRV